MISIFNGRNRTLGNKQDSVWIQTDVSFREHLHLFKGAKLAVFQAIALHSNEDGWSWPSLDTLSRETGYNRQTISAAIQELCELEIEGRRVMLKYQDTKNGRFGANHYLIFPTGDELTQYELPFTDAAKPDTEKPHTGFSYTEDLYSNHNQSKQEPVSVEDVQSPSSSAGAPDDSEQAIIETEETASPPAEEINCTDVVKAYQQELGYDVPSWGREAKAAKWLLEHGYSLNEIMLCYRDMKQEQFWRDKALHLQSVKNRIGEWRATHAVESGDVIEMPRQLAVIEQEAGVL